MNTEDIHPLCNALWSSFTVFLSMCIV